MARRRVIQIPFGDGMRDAFEVQFEVKSEKWNEYTLLDGGTIRLKTTLIKAFRFLDEDGKPAFTKEGEPLIAVRHNTLAAASV